VIPMSDGITRSICTVPKARNILATSAVRTCHNEASLHVSRPVSMSVCSASMRCGVNLLLAELALGMPIVAQPHAVQIYDAGDAGKEQRP